MNSLICTNSSSMVLTLTRFRPFRKLHGWVPNQLQSYIHTFHPQPPPTSINQHPSLTSWAPLRTFASSHAPLEPASSHTTRPKDDDQPHGNQPEGQQRGERSPRAVTSQPNLKDHKKERRAIESKAREEDKARYGMSGGPRIKELEIKLETEKKDLDVKIKKAKDWLLKRLFRVDMTMTFTSEGERRVDKEAALERFKAIVDQLTTQGPLGLRQVGGPLQLPEAKSIIYTVKTPTKSSFSVMIHPPRQLTVVSRLQD